MTTQDAGGGEPHWGTRPRRVLAFLRDFTNEHGYPPSMAQIGAAVGLTSSSSVAHQLHALEARGYITREPGRPRAITILDHPSDTTPDVPPAVTDLLLEYTHYLFDKQHITGGRFDHLPAAFLAARGGDQT